MKNLLIIGARGWGREVYNRLPECHGYGTEYTVKGYLDDKVDALDGMSGYPPIIDSVEHYTPQPDDVFICALGEPRWKKHYAEIILQKGGQFINVIHKTARIGRNTILGVGCILDRFADISCDMKVGNFVTITPFAGAGHDARIGDYSHLGSYSSMGGGAQIGELTTLHPHATILPHVKVGNNCVVGAGSVVLYKVKDNTTVYGNPAKVLKF